MNFTEIFNEKSINNIKTTLDEQCIDGRRLTRSELCHELRLTEPLNENSSKEDKAKNNTIEAVVGAIISMKVIPGYNSRQGKDGGIGKEVVEASDKPAKKGVKKVEFPEGFISNLMQTLETLCKDVCIPRKTIAEAMTLPEGVSIEKALTFITAAMKAGMLPGYASKPGVGGGFYTTPVSTSSVIPVIKTSTADTTSNITV